MWQCPIFNFSGYGDEGRAMITAMQKRGHPVTARAWGQEVPEFIDQLAASAPSRLLSLHQAVQTPLGHPFVSVQHMPGYCATPVQGAQANVMRTMFETDSIPADWVGRLNQMDEVWVPASFNRETFTRAGVSVPVEVVPGGVDGSLFRPGLRPLRVHGVRGTVFLSIFEWSYRKGWDVILSAWAAAFGPDDDASLVLRTAPHEGSCFDPNERIDAFLESIGKSRRDVAPIIVLDRPLSLTDLPRLYAAADVYVSASRGEGWGRPMIEAMACRLPTVATRWSGNLEFMDDENSVLLDIEGLRAIDGRAEFAFYRGHSWAEPSVEHLVEVMTRLEADAEYRTRIGARARADVERKWQWQQVSGVLAERIDALAERTGMRRTGVFSPASPGAISGSGSAGVGNGERGRALDSSGPAMTSPSVPSIRWEGDFYAHHSLAHVNRALAGRLAVAGLAAVTPVTSEAPPFFVDSAIEVERIGRSFPPHRDRNDIDLVVRHRWPPDLSSAGSAPLVLIQPWEFGGIPSAWIPQIRRNVAEVWCPTSWVRDCYVRSGVPESSVAVVPHGVDTDRFSPTGPGYQLRTAKATKFLFVGGTIARKGVDVLLRSYLESFGPDDDVCLVVKAFGSGHVYRGSTIDDQLRAVALDPLSAEVELIDDDLTEADMAALYRSCDVLVHPYRGEGFGLPVAEAMASGLPVIVTDYGACLDFCTAENALFVPSAQTPVEMTEIGPSSIGYWWAEPNADALAGIMRRVVDDPSVVSGMGEAGRRRILAEFTWNHVLAVVAGRLQGLVGSPSPV